MGLSGRKVKQRISADPRNLGWADDAARFGSNYLSKFGWDASKGLGASGDGMKTHIKVSHKLDMLGIGAAQTKDPNGIAWKQNRDFENLLQRLNEKLETEQASVADKTDETAAENKSDGEDGEKKKKKRKHKETAEEDRSERKKKKKHGEDKKEGDEESSSPSAQVESMQVDAIVETKTVIEVQKVVALPRHRAHRARLIAAKNIASKSAAHISEILGVAPESQAASTLTAAPAGKLTSVTDTDALAMDKLTTSTKTLSDYFKEKLNARMGSSSGTSTPITPRTDIDDAYDAPRGGIGASRMHLDIQSETKIEEETQRVGLSKFSSLMSSTFLAATSSISYVPPQIEQYEEMLDKDEGVAHISEVESDSETKEKSKKEKKRKEKKGKEASGEDKIEEWKGNKNKKDKKGKGKAMEEVEEDKDVNASEDEKRRKKEKKEKKKRAAEEALKIEAAKDESEDSSYKKEKKKHKAEELDATSAETEDNGKLKKEKKRRQTDS